MEGRRSKLPTIPANFVTLRHLQELRLKEKEEESRRLEQQEEEERRRRQLEREEEERRRQQSEREEEERRKLAEAVQSLGLDGSGELEGRAKYWRHKKKKKGKKKGDVTGESVIVQPAVGSSMPEADGRVIKNRVNGVKARSLAKNYIGKKDDSAVIVVGEVVIEKPTVDPATPASKTRPLAARTKNGKNKNESVAIVVGGVVIGEHTVDQRPAMPESKATVIGSHDDGVKSRAWAGRRKGKKKDGSAGLVVGEDVNVEPSANPTVPKTEARVINSRGDGVKARSSAAVKPRDRLRQRLVPPAMSSAAGMVWVPKSSISG